MTHIPRLFTLGQQTASGRSAPVAQMRPAIVRPMKTVVLFRPEALKEAFVWWQERTIAEDDPAQKIERVAKRIGRINLAHLYFCSLAFAHIPF